EKREENVEKGRELVEKEIKSHGFELKAVLTADNIANVSKKFNFTSEEDMYAAVGYGGITAAQIATRLTDKARKERTKEQEEELAKSIIEGKT
ncbi:RelA/SpoT AH/RIS domain-containing protein, partial [Staphylococcus sp. SIMBA_130]